jgi:cobyrinic acid a,c-diamide synthase
VSRILVVAGTASGVGSYLHLHFASNPSLARAFVDACAARAA